MRTTKVVLYSCQAAVSLCAWRSRALVMTIDMGIYIYRTARTQTYNDCRYHPRHIHANVPLALLSLCNFPYGFM